MQKGKKLENKFSSEWRSKIGTHAIRTPGSGSGNKFKEDVYTDWFSVECKNQEKISLYKWWDQARSHPANAKDPVLVMKSNHRPILVAMELDDWLNLVKEAKTE